MKTKIFVTTGSVLEFDSLIKEIDKINKDLKCDVVCQTGVGNYNPKHTKHYKFKKSLDKDYSWADIIITHTGAGTLLELLNKNKKIICISNPKAVDNHEIAENFAKEGYLLFLNGNKLTELNGLIKKDFKFKKYISVKSTISKEILKFILKS